MIATNNPKIVPTITGAIIAEEIAIKSSSDILFGDKIPNHPECKSSSPNHGGNHKKT